MSGRRKDMEVLSRAVATGPGPRRRARVEDELARLQAQVARLEAECAALQWAVGHDELTGLANRGMFCALAPPLLGTGRPAVVTVLDLNGFKPVNDRWGHDVGDAVLRIVAQRLAGCTGYDLVARLSGDEFTGIVTGRPAFTGNWWRPAVHALVAAIAEPMPVAGHTVHVTASVGITPACPGVPIDELLRRADLTMYRAKAGGGGFATWSEPTASRPTASGPTASEPAVEFTLSPVAR